MAQTYAEARTQDARWEGGRTALVRRGLGLGLARVLRGDFATASAAFDTASLPLSLLAFAGLGAGAAAFAGVGSGTLAIAALGSLGSYAVVGLAAARTPARDLRAAFAVPQFAAHKALVYARIIGGRGAKGWERTARAEN